MTELSQTMSAVVEQIVPEEVVALAQDLIAVPSDTPDGEMRAADVLQSYLEEAGIAVTRHPVPDAGENLVATLPGSSEETGLVLNGHLDTVPPSADMRYPPHKSAIEEGCLWGRGSVDMKGALAGMACALRAVRVADVPLKRGAVLTAVAAEERGNLGTAELIRKGIRARWGLVGEPTGLDVVIAHKGVERLQVIVEGKSAHESLPDLGVNAIVQAAHLVAALDRDLFRRRNTRRHPLLGEATYNIGTIEGGVSRNTVPDRCMFRLSKRWLPGDSIDRIRAELEDIVSRNLQGVRVRIEREPDFQKIPHPPLEVRAGHPLVRALTETVRLMTGERPSVNGWSAFTDAALLFSAGISTVVFGPGDLALAHTNEERVPLSQLLTAAKVYAAFVVTATSSEP